MGPRAHATGFTLLLLAAAGCASTRGEQDRARSPWLQPSPILASQIQDEIERVPWTSGFERLEQIRWFALVGEPAYDALLELAEDPRDDVASLALAALAESGDRRLVTHVRAIDVAPERLEGDLGLEWARTLLRLGDWSAVPRLVRGLQDERIYTRTLCIQALERATGRNMGFDPRGDETARRAAVDAWELWWETRHGEGLLGRRG